MEGGDHRRPLRPRLPPPDGVGGQDPRGAVEVHRRLDADGRRVEGLAVQKREPLNRLPSFL